MTWRNPSFVLLIAVALQAAGSHPATAEDKNADTQDLAKKLSNPVASLISLPLQFNYDRDIGTNDEGEQLRINFQPVVPIPLGDDWNVISRTIAPIVYQDDVVPLPGDDDQFGLGDIAQSLFFSPTASGPGGLIWGLGPIVQFPSATDDLVGSEKWAVGPTGVALVQRGHWTIGILANHLWSVGGNDRRADIDSTFLQPFVSYTTPSAWTFTLNSESTYDWEADHWSVPVNFQVSKLFKLGAQPVSLGGGIRYWAESPDAGPEGVGFRLTLTLLLPE